MKAAKDEGGEIQQARVICGFTHEGKRFEPDDVFSGSPAEIWQWEPFGLLLQDQALVAENAVNHWVGASAQFRLNPFMIRF